MIGAIIGDIVGSQFEFTKTIDSKDSFNLFDKKLCRFTDDTVCTIAIADGILHHSNGFETVLRYWCTKYWNVGYGHAFLDWLAFKNEIHYTSYGNGSAMRVSPCGWFDEKLQTNVDLAIKTAEITHNHPEGLKGASAITHAIWLAWNNFGKIQIKQSIEETYGYDLDLDYDEIRKQNVIFDCTCQVTVPQAIFAFLESESFEDAIRYAVSLGGDTDTIGAMTGSIAEAYYKDIPINVVYETMEYLPEEFKIIIKEFYTKYIIDKKHVNYIKI
jgi:ADP-ribosylglycohydrolase